MTLTNSGILSATSALFSSLQWETCALPAEGPQGERMGVAPSFVRKGSPDSQVARGPGVGGCGANRFGALLSTPCSPVW